MAEQSEEKRQGSTPPEKDWKELGKQYAEAYFAWLKEYASINKKAKNNNVTADDFNLADDKFNKRIEGLNKQEKELFEKSGDSAPKYHEYKDHISALVKEWEKNNPDIMNAVGNVKVFDEAFRKIYLSGAPQKNLTLPEGTNTPEAMLSALLQNNAGIAIGEIHSKENAPIFIANNIKTLKNSGVDTIYLEMGEKRFSQLNNTSVEELKLLLHEMEKPEGVSKAKQSFDSFYNINSRNVDNIDAAHVRLFLSAKENGIELVNIDQKGEARQMGATLLGDRGMETRFSSTNFTWVDEILKDRKNKPGGKYIVFGGLSHFGADSNSKGLVDEALGLPVIAFDNRDAGTGNYILRGYNPNGADFYLPAGNCHADLKLIAEIVNINDTIKSIQSWLPEIFHSFTLPLHKQFQNHMEELHKQVLGECTDVSEASNKKPLTTPPAPPAQQKQSPGQAH